MIDAKGGILVRYIFPSGGPSLHFFLYELATEEVGQTIRLLSFFYGTPTLREPDLSIIRKRESSQTILSILGD